MSNVTDAVKTLALSNHRLFGTCKISSTKTINWFGPLKQQGSNLLLLVTSVSLYVLISVQQENMNVVSMPRNPTRLPS